MRDLNCPSSVHLSVPSSLVLPFMIPKHYHHRGWGHLEFRVHTLVHQVPEVLAHIVNRGLYKKVLIFSGLPRLIFESPSLLPIGL